MGIATVLFIVAAVVAGVEFVRSQSLVALAIVFLALGHVV